MSDGLDDRESYHNRTDEIQAVSASRIGFLVWEEPTCT